MPTRRDALKLAALAAAGAAPLATLPAAATAVDRSAEVMTITLGAEPACAARLDLTRFADGTWAVVRHWLAPDGGDVPVASANLTDQAVSALFGIAA